MILNFLLTTRSIYSVFTKPVVGCSTYRNGRVLRPRKVRSCKRSSTERHSDPASLLVTLPLAPALRILSLFSRICSQNPHAESSLPLFPFFSIATACQSTLSPPNRTLQFVPSCLALLSAFSPLHPLTGVAYASAPLGLSAVGCQSFQLTSQYCKS